MYYYILESPPNRTTRQLHQKLRDILTNLSIVGEIVQSSPARTPAELTKMGISKGYTTIVAVGSDRHINEIATAILGRAALGVVPIDASDDVSELIGVRGLQDSAETLKQRKITISSLLLIEPETLVFLDIVMKPPMLSKATIVLDNKVRAHAYFQELRINRSLEVAVKSVHQVQEKTVFGLFKKKPQAVISKSLFHAKQARLLTEPELPITVAGVAVGKPPAQLRLIPDALKVITKRGTVLE